MHPFPRPPEPHRPCHSKPIQQFRSKRQPSSPLRRLRPLLALLGLLFLGAEAQPAHGASAADLELRIKQIDEELGQLAEYSLRSGVGPVGYRSKAHTEAESPEWIQIDLQDVATIDQIVLVPTIWRGKKSGLHADGFPIEFQIKAGIAPDSQGQVIATFQASDSRLPRIAPLLVPIDPIEASWVRLEASVLSPRIWDGLYILQLSEFLVFSGEENVALHQPVITPTLSQALTSSRSREYLVDGFVPYVMDGPQVEQSLAFTTFTGITPTPILTIDLGETVPINRIHLHGPDLSDTIPQALPDDYGIARHWLAEGATQADFSDATPLFEYKMNSIYDVGPIIMWRFPEKVARYVRLVALKPYLGKDHLGEGPQIALAEIEVFSQGENVAVGKTTTANFNRIPRERSLLSLTDGRNFYGEILPVREWMEQLAKRHDLETERPLILAKLNEHYAAQSRNLKRMGWLAAALTVGIIITILVDRMLRMREIASIRERFAADLHDELGANIHTIGLLGDVALKSLHDPERLQTVLERNRRLTERTGTAVRHCINLQEAKGLYGSLPDDMERTARRILTEIRYEIKIEGEKHLAALKPKERTDLLLFYKEALVNTSRHADATFCEIRLVATDKQITLSILDNGRGIPNSLINDSPNSLKRRAKLLGAKTTTELAPEGGTLVRLNYRLGLFRFLKK